MNATSRTVLATATTDASGNYTLTAPPNTSAFVRAKALSASTGSGAAELGHPGTQQLRGRELALRDRGRDVRHRAS